MHVLRQGGSGWPQHLELPDLSLQLSDAGLKPRLAVAVLLLQLFAGLGVIALSLQPLRFRSLVGRPQLAGWAAWPAALFLMWFRRAQARGGLRRV